MNVVDAIKTRRSVRSYSGKPIPPDVLERMRAALRYAPSACNYQPYRFIFVMDQQLRAKLAEFANGQLWMAEAPVTVVGCAILDQAYTGMGGHGNSAEIDVAIAFDHLTLAAVAEDLGTCWIGAFKEGEVRALLKVPAKAKVVAMTPLGYPSSPHLNAPLEETRRKPPEELFQIDRYR